MALSRKLLLLAACAGPLLSSCAPDAPGITAPDGAAQDEAAAWGSVQIKPDSLVLFLGDRFLLSLYAYDPYGNYYGPVTGTWSSSDVSVAAVSTTGFVTGLKLGTARISVSSEGRQDVIDVRVVPFSPIAVNSISIRSPVLAGNYSASIGLLFSRPPLGATVTIRGPLGTEFTCTGVRSGGYSSSTLSCSPRIPRGVEPGTWIVKRVTVWEQARPSIGYSRDQLRHDEVQATEFQVLSELDRVRPSVTALGTYRGAWFDTPQPPGTMGLSVAADDDASGVVKVRVIAQSPSGAQRAECFMTRVAGAPQDGTWWCDMAMPAGAEAGTWTVIRIYAWDLMNNLRGLGPAGMADHTFHTRFTWPDGRSVPIPGDSVVGG